MMAMMVMAMTHIRRLVTLKPVIQYPRKDILAPRSSTVNKKEKDPPDRNGCDDDDDDVDYEFR